MKEIKVIPCLDINGGKVVKRERCIEIEIYLKI